MGLVDVVILCVIRGAMLGPCLGHIRFIVFIFGMANSLCYMSSGMRLSMWNSCDHAGAMSANTITTYIEYAFLERWRGFKFSEEFPRAKLKLLYDIKK